MRRRAVRCGVRQAGITATHLVGQAAATGSQAQPDGGHHLTDAAGLSIEGEEVLSECMHIFGGAGYLVDETPIGRWWRDM
jgi:acyl-ACP dehydrogenase